jgi:pimeloyl-ACP methyl ester carboxylesterase
MATEFVTSDDGTRIAFERSGAGPVLVLVDGAAMHRAFGTSRGLARLLADAFTVVTYDRRGRGESGDTPPWAPAREVADLTAVIRAATSGRDEDGADGGVAVHTLSSGAVLALHAVAAGAPIRSMSLFEPPIDPHADPAADTVDIEAVARLVRDGRRREAVQAFQAGIGMPAEMIAGQPPEVLDALDAVAPTLVYDLALTRAGSMPPEVLAAVRIPALVLSSDTGSGPLGGWAAALAAALPAARHQTLPGSWHGVPEDLLAGAIRDAANRDHPAAHP